MNRALSLLDWSISQPHKACVVTDARAYSFLDVGSAIRKTAGYLESLVGPGTRVGLFIDNTPNFILYQYATYYLGGVVVPLNRSMKFAEVQEAVHQLGVSVMISDTPLELAGEVAAIVVTGEFDVPDFVGQIPPPADVAGTAGATILQTSGTTGRPKGILLSVQNLRENYDATYRWIGVGKDDRILLALPVFNTYALNQGINLMTMTGATLRLLSRFSTERMQEVMDEFQPTFVPLVPTMVARLHRNGARYGAAVRICIGAAASPAEIVRDAWQVFPKAHVFFAYGLTEATAICSVHHIGTLDDNNGDFRSVGVVVPGLRVKIDSPTGEDNRGEVMVSGESVFVEYVGADDPRPVSAGWLNTGDVGRFDDAERLHIVDRKRELIIRGGQNIYPGEVERVLTSHEAVSEAAVVGRLDGDLGELPIAFVVLRPKHKVRGADLAAWARTQMAQFKVPAEVVVVDSLPKTPTGKIKKLRLREVANSGVVPANGPH